MSNNPKLHYKITLFEYDEKGLKTGTTQPNGATTKNEFDASGNQKKTTNALGFSSETPSI